MPVVTPPDGVRRKRPSWIARKWRHLREEVGYFDPAAWATTAIIGLLCFLWALGFLSRLLRIAFLYR
jgi:hypothetical protein